MKIKNKRDKMSQDYAEGNLYENLTKEIFKTLGIEIQIFDYAKHPDKQNEGIDAEITYPLNLKGVSLQIKMFRNTEKYGTFPWEVSRYLKEMKDFVEEPHNADFHIVIDPIEISISELKLIFWIIKTGNLPGYYRDIWKDAIKEFGIPSNDNSNWEKKTRK